jgi:hypothetical protein
VALAPSAALAAANEPGSATKTFEFGIGLLGNFGMARLGQPSSPTIEPKTADASATSYPGFTGSALSGGLFLEGRVLEHVGVEIGVQYGRDCLTGELDQGSSTTKVTMRHPVLLVPILLKGVLPLGSWAPFVVAGPQITRYGLSESLSDPDGGLHAVASALPSLWWLFGIGAEWKAPFEAVDLRVPIGLRFGFNPKVTDDVEGRAQSLGSGAIVLEDAAPAFRLTLATGAAVYF